MNTIGRLLGFQMPSAVETPDVSAPVQQPGSSPGSTTGLESSRTAQARAPRNAALPSSQPAATSPATPQGQETKLPDAQRAGTPGQSSPLSSGEPASTPAQSPAPAPQQQNLADVFTSSINSWNPFISQTLKQALADPTLSSAAKSELSKAEGDKDPVLGNILNTFFSEAERNTFAAIEKHDPVGYKCLTAMVSNAPETKFYQAAGGDPDKELTLDATLVATLKRMQTEFAAGKPGFSDHVMQTARKNLGADDAAIYSILSQQASGSPPQSPAGSPTPGSPAKSPFAGSTSGSPPKSTFGGAKLGSPAKSTVGGAKPGSPPKSTFGGARPGLPLKISIPSATAGPPPKSPAGSAAAGPPPKSPAGSAAAGSPPQSPAGSTAAGTPPQSPVSPLEMFNDVVTSWNPFTSSAYKQALKDPTLSAVAKAELGRVEGDKEPPLRDILDALCNESERKTWDAIEKHDPVGYKCLSAMVSNATETDIYKAAMKDPHQEKLLNDKFAKTVKRMHSEFAQGKTDFCDHVMQTMKKDLGVNDTAVFANLSTQFDAKALGFEATNNLFFQDNNGGACHRESTKWAALQTVGGQFKFDGMDVDSVRKKQREYIDASDSGAFKDVAGGADYVSAKAWTSKFTGADKTKYINAVDVSPPEFVNPEAALKQGLLEGQAMLIGVRYFDRNGDVQGHTIGVSGGEDLKLFDAETNTEFAFKGDRAEFGKQVEKYLEEFCLKPAGYTQALYDVMPMAATKAASVDPGR